MPNSLLKASALSLALRLFRVFSLFALSIAVARIAGPESFGIYSLAMATSAIALVVASLGMPTVVLRRSATYFSNSENENLSRLLVEGAFFSFFASGVISLTGIFLLHSPLGDSFSDPLQTALTVALLIPVPLTLLHVVSAVPKGTGNIIKGQLAEMLFYPGLTIAFLGLSFTIKASAFTPHFIVALNLIAAVVAAFGALIIALRAAPGTVFTNDKHSIMRGIKNISLYLALHDGAIVIFQNIDLLMLGALANTLDVGVYRISVQFSMFVGVGLGVINMVSQPKFAQNFYSGNSFELSRLFSENRRLSLWFSVISGLSLLAFGPTIISVFFGTDYSDAYLPTLILVLGFILNISFGPIGALLNMSGNEKIVFWSVLLSIALNIVLNWILIVNFGIIGAAVATAASVFLSKVFLYFAARKRLREILANGR